MGRPMLCRARVATTREALRPLQKEAVDRLVPYVATPEQLAWFGGKTESENYEQFLETSMIAFVGLWAAYFASFFMGSGFAVLAGTGFAANGLFRPYLAAYMKSSSIRGSIDDGDYTGMGNKAALFSGVVSEVYVRGRASGAGRKNRFGGEGAGEFDLSQQLASGGYTPRARGGQVSVSTRQPLGGLGARDGDAGEGYSRPAHGGGGGGGEGGGGGGGRDRAGAAGSGRQEMAGARPGRDFAVVVAADEEGRELSVEAPFDPAFESLVPGMACEALVFGRGDFSRLHGASDLFVPEADCWVGPYPYLDRSEFRRFLGARDRRRPKKVRSRE